MDRWRRRRRALVVTAAMATLGAAVASSASADEAAPLYDPGTVWVIHLTLPKASEEKLEADPEGEYQPGEFSIAETEGTPGSEKIFSTPIKVEMRLKGSTSFEPLSAKAAFKLKFKKGERPFGLKKMTLNNMVQDPSMVHETLSYEEFREAGVPAPRTGFAYLYVNGHDYGMHLDLETVDDQALERMFGTKFEEEHQHLYEGEDGTDVIPGDATNFEVDEGEEGNIADLEALIAAVNGSGAEPWSTRVAPYADLAEMTRMWAAEKYVGQWDGYSGQVGTEQPNNYYLYDDTAGVFQMIPWGTDETFESNEHIAFDGQAGVLFDRCIEDEACFDQYWHSLSAILATARSLDLPARAATLDAMLKPWQEQEQGDGRFHYSRGDANAAAIETGEYATLRIGEAEAWLAAHEPKEPTPPDQNQPTMPDGGGSSQGTPSSGSTPSTAPAPPSVQAPRLRGLRARGSSLTTSLLLSAVGTVSQQVTFDLDGKRRVACDVAAAWHEAGPLLLRCTLRPAAKALLEEGPLSLLVLTTVRSDDGTRSVLRRKVTLHKR